MNINKIKILIGILVIIASLPTSLSADKKEDVFAKLTQKINASEAIYLECKNKEQGIEATIQISKDGKYKLTLGYRVVVCDGESIWNYSSKQNRLIINDYHPEEGTSIENIIYALAKTYKPVSFNTVSTSSMGKVYKMRIKDENPDLPEATIWISPKTNNILKMKYESEEYGGETWEISKMRFLKKDNAKYRLKVKSKKTKVIDLR